MRGCDEHITLGQSVTVTGDLAMPEAPSWGRSRLQDAASTCKPTTPEEVGNFDAAWHTQNVEIPPGYDCATIKAID
eukprot:COSAG03_NODE_9061_length_748_cov_8.419106_1_plen_76_part_00